MAADCLSRVRDQQPRIHCITNYVSANDCANILLACGARPILADDPGESAEITALCRGLDLNLGTLSDRRLEAMLLSGAQANRMGIPVVLDPVGVGASRFRRAAGKQLLETVKFTVIRGNLSELRALALDQGSTGGVDAEAGDRITEETLPRVRDLIRGLSRRTGAVVAVTGAMDLVTDGEKTICLFNGDPMMGRVTGTGCQLSALTAAFAAANGDRPLEAAAAALSVMGVCGELARKRLKPGEGTMTYRNYLIDGVSLLDGDTLLREVRYQIL